ncbi:hypothetical protein MTR67_023925 [Solanum verrucosum]|uniref:DUF4218 domain-containing protein n=1 Tax=Solanum verrucosum TaxID=315347 RepID=A0AAF0R0R0_SOLVR|nr:hypothetical protein MTR67_023925 [Solanum verrucosum]
MEILKERKFSVHVQNVVIFVGLEGMYYVAQAEGVYDGPKEDAKKFYNLVEEASQELYPGCTGFSKLSFTLRLYLLKCLHGLSNESFTSLLELLKEAMPELNISPSYNKTKSMVKNLDLDYEKIDAYPNDCMLFRNDHKDDEFCHTCGASRYIKSPQVDSELEPSKKHRVLAKTLRHFPLIPRLKRLFMCSKTADSLRWHDEERSKDGKLRHPADGLAWKDFDRLHPDFALDYHNHNLLRHNLDVMHIEKNIVDSILGTLLDISGKTKYHAKARYDLKDMGIRKNLHPKDTEDSKRTKFPKACFSMTNGEKSIFCRVLKIAKLPDGSASNISRCVHLDERKVSNYKTHDAHFMLHYLLPIPIKSILPDHVAIPLIRLSTFFCRLCQKVITLEELDCLEVEIIETINQLERIFPPSFSDIMIHLPIHLANEVRLGGPVQNRWMYSTEREMGTFKSYIRNKRYPEGCIAETRVGIDCINLFSKYLHGGVHTRFNRRARNNDECDPSDAETVSLFPNKGVSLGAKKIDPFILDNKSLSQAHAYLLGNCDEVQEYIRIVDIVELDYYGHFKEEPFVLGSQVHQCFYVQDPYDQDRHYVMKTVPRELFNMSDEVESDLPQGYENEPFEYLMGPSISKDNSEVLLTRTNVPETIIDVPSEEFVTQQLAVEYEEEFEDESADEFEDESKNEYEDESENEYEDEFEDEFEEEFEDYAP